MQVLPSIHGCQLVCHSDAGTTDAVICTLENGQNVRRQKRQGHGPIVKKTSYQ